MVGRTIAHFNIIEKLGEGGMGVVYKAADTHLDRFVAIKVLPPEKVADPERKRRFVQEAKAASALNHPNIVHIYDISTDGGADFIAMEFVVGKTLDRLIGHKGMRMNEALKHAVEIADALATAHAAGIVHRDLKPSNIMVDEHGRIKLLDFGLAKLTEMAAPGPDEPTRTARPQTDEGTIVGTVEYMSPEQAQGKPVDARSDIFSLGAVLYEMVTGRRAFHGETKFSTLAAIINKDPAPLSVELPGNLEKVISRCLRKQPERRFQHMADLKVELEEVKLESESGISAAETPARKHRTRHWLVAGAVTVGVLAATAWFLLRPAVAPLPPASVVPLTAYPGNELYPTFSPDGNQVAFAWDGEKQDNWDIYVKMVGTVTPLRLTTDPAPDKMPAWSPDGRQIAFVRGQGEQASIYLISPLGGPERKLAEFQPTGNLLGNPPPLISWSPDGKWLAVAERDPSGVNGIFRVPVERGEKRRLTSNQVHFDQSPAFSPDGRYLAYVSCTGDFSCDVYLTELGPDALPWGQPRRVTRESVNMMGLAWTPDGKSVVCAAGVELTNPYLWRVRISGTQKPEILELAGHQARHPAISATANRLAWARGGEDVDVWKYEVGGTPKCFIASSLLDANPQFSPDGKRILFASNRAGGGTEMWITNADGTNPMQVTNRVGRHQGSPRWSPDGRWILFDSQGEDGYWNVYVSDPAGGQPRRIVDRLTTQPRPSFSRDGKWIYFASNRTGRLEIWRTPASGGESVQMTDNGGHVAFESWDGKTLYFTKVLGSHIPRPLFTRSLEGGPERQVVDSVVWSAFSPVEDGIYYMGGAEKPGVYPLRFYDFSTGTSRVLVRIEAEVWHGLTVSPDRKTVLFSAFKPINYDLMMIENFR